MQTVLESQQNLSSLLEQASREGEVRIQREDGQTFVLRPERAKPSPLDVKGVNLGLSAEEIVTSIQEGRKEF